MPGWASTNEQAGIRQHGRHELSGSGEVCFGPHFIRQVITSRATVLGTPTDSGSTACSTSGVGCYPFRQINGLSTKLH